MSRSTALLFAAATLMAAPLLAVLAAGFIGSADLLFYATALKDFSAELWAGEAYPRLLADANGGLGSPVFFFYPPAGFYIGSLFAPLAPLDPDGIFRLALTLWAATFCSGLTARAWLAGEFGDKAGRIGALIYVLLPYRLVFLYLDFSIGQTWALAWFPLILLHLDRLRRGERRAAAPLALCYALLLLTHLLSFVTFAPVSLGYVLLRGGWRPTLLAGGAAALGVALAGGYLVPLFANRGDMDIAGYMFSGPFSYAANFATTDFLLTAPFLLLAAGWVWAGTDAAGRRTLVPFLVLMAGLLVMMTRLSKPLWDALPPLWALQFPVKRFYAPLLPVLAVLGLRLAALPGSVLVRAAAALLFVALHIGYVADAYRREGWPAPVAGEVATLRARIRATDIVFAREYRTRWTDPATLSLDALERWRAAPLAEVRDGAATVSVARWSPRRIDLAAEVTSDGATLLLRRLYFPGWRAVDPAGAALPVAPAPGDGRIALRLPHGTERLTLRLDRVPGQRAGWLASALALAAVLALWRWGRVSTGETRTPDTAPPRPSPR